MEFCSFTERNVPYESQVIARSQTSGPIPARLWKHGAHGGAIAAWRIRPTNETNPDWYAFATFGETGRTLMVTKALRMTIQAYRPHQGVADLNAGPLRRRARVLAERAVAVFATDHPAQPDRRPKRRDLQKNA